MINLPILHRLDVDGYGLYPGTESDPGLHIDFASGLTLVLGANGLGKTTLVTILFRMLTGPVDIPTLDYGGELGDRRLDSRTLIPRDRQTFAARVRDGAAGASARLQFYLGETRIEVGRRLRSLELLYLVVDGDERETTELAFQEAIQNHAMLSTFGDWILALRHLTFYFEDRRALVWDPSAQKQLLRLLFLPPDEALSWTQKEREILRLDSSYRNLQYIVSREERATAKTERAIGSADEVRQQLALLQGVQEDDEARLLQLNDELVDVTAERQTARLNSLRAEQDYESLMRDVERLQLHLIEAAFPSATDTARYIVGHILANENCLTCGSHVPDFTRLIEDRIRDQACPVCGSPVDVAEPGTKASRRLARAAKRAQDLEVQKATAAANRTASEKTYDELLNEVTVLNARVAQRSAEMNDLVKRLPSDERTLHKRRTELTITRGRLEEEREALNELRHAFKGFVAGVNTEIVRQKEAIKDAFDDFATDFLFETCRLKWSPQHRRVGQTGELLEFAAFEVDMTGADFISPVVRTGPSQVSESQREFIDLSFRMALMTVASGTGGSLIIDAPESSLDAVFVSRAADVLTRFGAAETANRLVVTSNLVDGDLIPALLRRSSITSEDDPRIVDLLKIATPTAATARLHSDYESIRERLFRRAGEVSDT